MKKLYANAAVTSPQRIEVKRLFEVEKVPVAELAKRFCIGESAIRKWIRRASPQCKYFTPQRKRTVVTPEYRQAVLDYRRQHPTHGPKRIALALQATCPQAHRGTAALILQESGMSQRPKRRKPKGQIPVGQHRLQCDVQELPAVQWSKGFVYKISFIHLRTRWKYSEIHSHQKSQTMAAVYRRDLDHLPPFFITFTDNAMSFTMKYTAHPERKTAFTKEVEKDGRTMHSHPVARDSASGVGYHVSLYGLAGRYQATLSRPERANL